VSLSDASGDNSTPSVIQPNNGIPTPSGQAPFAQPSSLASELTDPEVTITLSTSSNNRDRWSAYVSYHPVKSGLFWHRTVHAGTCDAVTSKAEEFAARWKAEANVTQLIDGDAPEDAPPRSGIERSMQKTFLHLERSGAAVRQLMMKLLVAAVTTRLVQVGGMCPLDPARSSPFRLYL
jgi:hypothetical protein